MTEPREEQFQGPEALVTALAKALLDMRRFVEERAQETCWAKASGITPGCNPEYPCIPCSARVSLAKYAALAPAPPEA